MICPKCGTDLQEETSFCPSCGEFLGVTKCPSCGEHVTPGAAFCPHCGVDLPKTAQEVKDARAKAAAKTQQDPQPAANAQQPNIVINNTNTNTNTNKSPSGIEAMTSPKSRWIALLLCFFFGGLGVHRFYVGKIGTGILYLCTLGLFGVGWIIDLFAILFGSFRDKYGFWLRR